MAVIQYGQCEIKLCSINGIPHEDETGATAFNVREIKIFEDHCKPYFTGQLTIETYQHAHEAFLFPTAEVLIVVESPSSDHSFKSKVYSERFRVFSHESREAQGGQFVSRLVHTISLIGQEYYNDKHNNVMKMDKNIPATTAAKMIHDSYVQRTDVGSAKIVVPSSGPIGSERHPHQSTNLKPFKAINDLLDRATWTQYKSCCPVYFRNKSGHVIAPLQSLLEARPLPILFTEIQGQGAEHIAVLGSATGYQRILGIKPLAPSGEASSGVRASEIAGLMKAVSYFNTATGDFNNIASKFKSIIGGFNIGVPGLSQKIKPMMEEAYKGNRGGGFLLNIIDEVLQNRAIDKNGPAGYNVAQEALVTALTYADKYWVQVPGQSGHKVTCGDKIAVRFTKIRGGKPVDVDRVLYIARLVHHMKFYEGDERNRHGEIAKTEMFGVSWGY